MKIAIGSDEKTHLTDSVVDDLRERGYEVELFGPLQGSPELWPQVGRQVAERVAAGEADLGVLFCWTGTGVSIAANKVPGIRAALCDDVETARGARKWNDANVLCLSLRRTPEVVAREILDAWLSTPHEPDEEDREALAQVRDLEAKYFKPSI